MTALERFLSEEPLWLAALSFEASAPSSTELQEEGTAEESAEGEV